MICEFRKRCLRVRGEAFQNHLQTLATPGGNFIQRTDGVLLEGVFLKVVKTALAIHHVLPVTNHPNVAQLRVDPVAFLERIVVTGDAWHQALAIQEKTFR